MTLYDHTVVITSDISKCICFWKTHICDNTFLMGNLKEVMSGNDLNIL